MPYTTPPNFNPGSVLSAAQMNIITDNQQYFYGLVNGVNGGFPSQRFLGIDVRVTNWSHLFYKQARYLSWRIQWHSGEFEQQLIIFVDHWTAPSWTPAYSYTIFTDGNPGGTPPYTAPHTWNSPPFDLEDAGYQAGGIPDRQFFRVWIQADNNSNLDFEVVFLGNTGIPINP